VSGVGLVGLLGGWGDGFALLDCVVCSEGCEEVGEEGSLGGHVLVVIHVCSCVRW
jgi:hypothetical protein